VLSFDIAMNVSLCLNIVSLLQCTLSYYNINYLSKIRNITATLWIPVFNWQSHAIFGPLFNLDRKLFLGEEIVCFVAFSRHSLELRSEAPGSVNRAHKLLHPKPYLGTKAYKLLHPKPYLGTRAYKMLHRKPYLVTRAFKMLHPKPYFRDRL